MATKRGMSATISVSIPLALATLLDAHRTDTGRSVSEIVAAAIAAYLAADETEDDAT